MLSTIKNSDLILVMGKGKIVKSCTHEDLISQGTKIKIIGKLIPDNVITDVNIWYS